MKSILTTILTLFISATSFAQGNDNPAVWKTSVQKLNDNELNLKFEATIKKNWQLYSNDFDPDLGPMITEFVYEESVKKIGKTIPNHPKKKYDDLWGGDYTYFINKAEFNQKIEAHSTGTTKVLVSYQVCSEEDGRCIPFEETLEFTF